VRGAGASAGTTRCQTRRHWSISLALIFPVCVAPAFVVALSLSLSLSLVCSLLRDYSLSCSRFPHSLSLSSLSLSLSLSLSYTHMYIHTLKRRGSTDEFGRTAIMLAVSRRDKHMTEILLRAGANVEGITLSVCVSLCVCSKVAGIILSTPHLSVYIHYDLAYI